MTRSPVGVAPEATLREVAGELADDEIGTVVVENPGGTVGLVSERDLVRAVAAGDDLDDRQAADLMSTDLVTARPYRHDPHGRRVHGRRRRAAHPDRRRRDGGRHRLRARRPPRSAPERPMNNGTTLAPRPRRVDGLVVVSDTPDLPGWVRDWSRRAGRQLHVHTSPRYAPPVTGRHRPDCSPRSAAWATDPVLVVPTGSADTLLRQVTAALHDLPDDEPVLAAAADTARQVGGPLVLTHALPVSFAEHSVGLRSALAHAHRVLDAAARRLAAENPDLTVETRLVRAHPHELVGENLDTGLLVIGGPRRGSTDDLGLVARTALQPRDLPGPDRPSLTTPTTRTSTSTRPPEGPQT